jgi:hypothetical protein
MKITAPDLIDQIANEIRNGTAEKKITKAELNKAFGFEKLSKDRAKKISKLLISLGITTTEKLTDSGEITFVIAHAQEKKRPPAHVGKKEGTMGSLRTMHSKPVCILENEPQEALFARLTDSGIKGYVIISTVAPTKDNNRFQGPKAVISWKSYARALEDSKGKTRKLSPLQAKDHGVRIKEVKVDELITEHYPDDNTVYVMTDENNNIIGCSSTREIDKELSRGHLWPYFLLKTIETLLRERIVKSRLTQGEIQEAIQNKKATDIRDIIFDLLKEKNLTGPELTKADVKRIVQKRTGKAFKGVDRMDMGECEDLFADEEIFPKLKMHGNAESVKDMIKEIRLARNELMHFNPCEGKDYPAFLLESLAKLRDLFKQPS